ncbi:unnamed protein product [Anisakis simplex]|uniref:UAS domain-containing protein n=1 Tax=Anisakis simplex TaxID=6269 RepID=A0A0M3K5C4_ANISI|nr:unnamed protein product [Anisakis simplex]
MRIKCKELLSTDQSLQKRRIALDEERKKLLTGFHYDERDIHLDDLCHDQEALSIVDLRTKVEQSVWTYLTKVFEHVSNSRTNGPDESLCKKLSIKDAPQRKMIDFFNERFVTMMPERNAKRIYRKMAKRLQKNKKTPRVMLLRFDDDNADVCCVYYSNVDDYNQEPLQSHTPFREILNTNGGFWTFMRYPFSRKFNYIVQMFSAGINEEMHERDYMTSPGAWDCMPSPGAYPPNCLSATPTCVIDYCNVAEYSQPRHAQQALTSSQRALQSSLPCVDRISPCTTSSVLSTTPTPINETATDIRMESINVYAFRTVHIREIFKGIETNEKQDEIFAFAGNYEVHAKTGQKRETREIEDAESLSGLFNTCSVSTFDDTTRI